MVKKIFIFLNLIIFLFLLSACSFEHKIKIHNSGYDYKKNSLYIDISYSEKVKISSFVVLNGNNKEIINEFEEFYLDKNIKRYYIKENYLFNDKLFLDLIIYDFVYIYKEDFYVYNLNKKITKFKEIPNAINNNHVVGIKEDSLVPKYASGVLIKYKYDVINNKYIYYLLTVAHFLSEKSIKENDFIIIHENITYLIDKNRFYIIGKGVDLAILTFETSFKIPNLNISETFSNRQKELMNEMPAYLLGYDSLSNKLINKKSNITRIVSPIYGSHQSSDICNLITPCNFSIIKESLGKGSSGGGVFDANNNLIGIISATNADSNTLFHTIERTYNKITEGLDKIG